jgi:hypothetical protein
LEPGWNIAMVYKKGEALNRTMTIEKRKKG